MIESPMTMHPLNRLYWYYERILRRNRKNGNSCEWLELGTTPNFARLERAAYLTAQRHPAGRARIKGHVLRAPTWTDDAPAPKVTFQRIPMKAPLDAADKNSEAVWGVHLDLENGPPWRINVVQYDDKTFMQIITNHIFTDGKAANLLVHDFVDAYDALTKNRTFDTTPRAPLTRDPYELYLQHRPKTAQKGAVLRSLKGIVRELMTSCVKLPTKSNSIGRTRVAMVDYGPEMLDHLRLRSKQEGVSRHPFFVSALSETLACHFGDRLNSTNFKIIDNFSIRGYAAQDMSNVWELCAVPYGLNVPITKTADADFRKAVSAKIFAFKAGSILDDLVRFKLYMQMAYLSPKLLSTRLVLNTIVKSNVFLSNIGTVPEGIIGNSALDIREYYSFSQLFPPGKLMFLVSTTDTSLRAICLWDDKAFDEVEVRTKIMPLFAQRLRAGQAANDVPKVEVSTVAEAV